MIIVTGYKGFIGRNFLKKFDDVVIKVDVESIDWLINKFSEWDKVDMVIHQGAM